MVALFLRSPLAGRRPPRAVATLGLLALACVGPLLPRAAAAEAKVGPGSRAYVDVSRVLNEVEEGRAAKEKLKGDVESRQKRISRMEGELKEKKESFDKQRAVMKSDARAQKEEELQREMYELQKVVMQLEQELVESQNLVTREIDKKLRSVVEKIGDREGYDEVLGLGDLVLYHKRHRDITDLVIREYNKQFAKK